MKTKNNSKKVEKTFSYSVVDITLLVEQNCMKRGILTRLISEYRLAFTDDDSLSKFISFIKKDPIKYYRRHFGFNAPIISKVDIAPVDVTDYHLGRTTTRKKYLVLGEYTNLSIHDLLKHNRDLVDYYPNLK